MGVRCFSSVFCFSNKVPDFIRQEFSPLAAGERTHFQIPHFDAFQTQCPVPHSSQHPADLPVFSFPQNDLIFIPR